MDRLEIILMILILVLPLVGAVISYLALKQKAGIVISLAFLMTIGLTTFGLFNLKEVAAHHWEWFGVGAHHFTIGLYYDHLSAIMALVVAVVAFLVALFSMEYMKHDESQPRYFALLGLFAFSMYGIIFSSNLLLTFVFWELVGFSSYLLIGFWHEKEAPPISSFKAFLMNKVGDIGFLLGIFILFAYFKTLNIQALIDADVLSGGLPQALLITMGLGLFLAAVGKSAQFPLQTWLPDAMTGPTPVSALIHAATMVAAGVYLMVRIFPLLSQDVLIIIGTIGGITAFMGAFAAFAQYDIKKILAFSTVSQLGYMMMAVGAGFPQAAFFHLVTHAFFKAGLFLCSGSIIHFYHETEHTGEKDAQDIRNMGGLRKVLPFTFAVFTICMASLTGLPLFSGFLSKEAILNGLVSASHLSVIVVYIGFAAVFMTAAYMGRLYFKIFFNGVEQESSFKEGRLVKWPLVILSLLSLGVVFSFNPFNPDGSWLVADLNDIVISSEVHHYGFVPFVSLGLAFLGLVVSYFYVEKKQMMILIGAVKRWFFNLSNKNFYLDGFYRRIVVKGSLAAANVSYQFDRYVIDRSINLLAAIQVVIAHIVGWIDFHLIDGVVDSLAGLVRFIGHRTRQIQDGNLQRYLTWALLGFLLIFYFLY